jgi:hypothetical protein
MVVYVVTLTGEGDDDHDGGRDDERWLSWKWLLLWWCSDDARGRRQGSAEGGWGVTHLLSEQPRLASTPHRAHEANELNVGIPTPAQLESMSPTG